MSSWAGWVAIYLAHLCIPLGEVAWAGSLSPGTQSSLNECLKIWTRIAAGSFHEKRDLLNYEQVLGSSFFESLTQLRPNQIWLDSGSGQTRAVTEYLEQYPRGGQAVAVTIKPIDDPARVYSWVHRHQRLRMLVGKDLLEIPSYELGQPNLITDLMGALSYTKHPHRVLQTYLDILDQQGSIFIHSDFAQTQILRTDGTPMRFDHWLKSIPGIEVTGISPGTLQVQKRIPKPKIPELTPLTMVDGQPPIRKLQERKINSP